MQRETPIWQKTAIRCLTHGCALLSLAVLLRVPAGALPGQDTSAYERTILEIQQRIETGKLDEARNEIADAVRRYPQASSYFEQALRKDPDNYSKFNRTVRRMPKSRYLFGDSPVGSLWWAVRDSNPRLPACKAGALTN